MSLYNIVGASSLVAGQPEDISQVLANLQAIQTILNGGIDNTNINAAAGIVASKLSGYPADGTKFLGGDGTWKIVPPSSLTGYPANAVMALRGDGTWNAIQPTRQVLVVGSGTYTTPVGCKAIIVECIGGGGAGGGCPTTAASNFGAGGGGAGACYAKKLITAPAATYSYTVGAGGTGVLNAGGNTGADSNFGGGLVLGKGGGGGAQTSQNVANILLGGPGVPVAGSVGDIVMLGAPGTYGRATGTLALGGAGGMASHGGGGGIENVTNGADGAVGSVFGGGGAGGANGPSAVTARTGGAGGAGTIIVWEFY